MPSPPRSSPERSTVSVVGGAPGPRPGRAVPRVLSVLHVDQQTMFTEAVSRCLADEPDLLPSGSVPTYQLARAAYGKVAPDVILVEPWAGGSGGVEAIRSLRAASPESIVVVVTDRADPHAIASSIRAGVRGYVLKSRGIGELITVIRQAAAGETTVALADVPSVILGLRPGGQVGADAGPAFSRLTDRERQILAELTAGISTAEIAERLHISPLTVRSHVKSILSKLNVHSKLEAVTLAMRHGMFQDERRA